MKPAITMRKTILIVFTILMYGCLPAQLKSIFPTASFTDSLSRVINDAGQNYYSIQGISIANETDRDSYQSKVTLPGSVQCMIYRYHSVEDTTASWQAIMYKGENYKEAVKSYRQTFRFVKRSRIAVENKNVAFEGNMEEPDESLRFRVSTLRTNIPGSAYNNFIAEVEMINTYEGWEVHLNLQRRKNDMERY